MLCLSICIQDMKLELRFSVQDKVDKCGLRENRGKS